MNLLRVLGASMLLLARTVSAARRQRPSFRHVLEQASELGASSSVLVFAGMSFFGMVMVTIAHAQARKYTGNITVVGPAYFELIVREFAPMLGALLAASRAAAAVSAELGAMAVNEQIEALELSAAEPLSELVAPRVLASLLTVPALMVLGTVAATGSALLTVNWAFGADGSSFVDARFLDAGDIACAGVKSVLCALFIPLAASVRGLAARQGAAAVGEAVTNGVVEACMGCLLIDFLVAAVFLVLGW